MLLDVSLESQTITLVIHGIINTIGLGGFTGDLFIPAYATRIMLKMWRFFVFFFCRTIPRTILWAGTRGRVAVSEECSLGCWWSSWRHDTDWTWSQDWNWTAATWVSHSLYREEMALSCSISSFPRTYTWKRSDELSSSKTYYSLLIILILQMLPKGIYVLPCLYWT